MTTATTQSFTFVLDRVPADAELDTLFEAGCDDATPETNDGAAWLHFDRTAETLPEALVSALQNVEAAGFTVMAVQSDDLVSMREIAHRTGRTYESVRLLAKGDRGPGGFPAPLSSAGWSLYSWTQVAAWFGRQLPTTEASDTPTEYDRIIAAADYLVRARAILHGADPGPLADLVA